jgi:hypothetical protein
MPTDPLAAFAPEATGWVIGTPQLGVAALAGWVCAQTLPALSATKGNNAPIIGNRARFALTCVMVMLLLTMTASLSGAGS